MVANIQHPTFNPAMAGNDEFRKGAPAFAPCEAQGFWPAIVRNGKHSVFFDFWIRSG
jgi:hypothetical protein